MANILELNLTPEGAATESIYLDEVAKLLGVRRERIAHCRILRRSVDARRRGDIRVNMAVEVFVDDEDVRVPEFHAQWGDVSASDHEVIVVGAGPAGLFLALELIELGIRPIVLERGRSVSERKHDVAALNRGGDVNQDSNYAFGEGGAGTYSDGKLYTRSKKRGSNAKALEIFRYHGAPESIMYDAHPHIGTDKLPGIISAIRETICACGGRVVFDSRVTGFIMGQGRILGVETAAGERILAPAVALATGHSARDIYELLHESGVLLQAKPFAMGVRVEHQQSLIDTIQYKLPERGPWLPAASYSLVAQVGTGAGARGVYSFCMCPGGFIVPAMTSQGECVVNGMSPSGRNNVFANSGVVCEVRQEDYADLIPHFGVLAGMKFQQQVEMMGFAQGGGAQRAPAQLLTDFVLGQSSPEVLETSYHPGVVSSDMDKWLPRFMSKSLREGLRLFDNKMRGYITEQAQIIGVESRTSSPVRVPRDRDTFMHPVTAGLFPLGEGAGYAGGIISAAVDGLAVAAHISSYIKAVK